MHTARLHVVPWGGERYCHLCQGREGGVVTWSRGGGRCCDLCPEGGREVLWPVPRGGGGMEVLSPGPGGRRCCNLCPGLEGGVVTWSRGGQRCCHLCLGRGGRCCHLLWGLGREVLWPGPGGGREVLWPGPGGREGGVVTCARGGEHGRCCDLCPRGEGGVVQRPLVLHSSPSPCWTEWVTHACINITFARFATQAVKIAYPFLHQFPPFTASWLYERSSLTLHFLVTYTWFNRYITIIVFHPEPYSV